MPKAGLRVAMVGGCGHQYIAAAFGKDDRVRFVAVAGDGRDDRFRQYRGRDFCGSDVQFFDHFEDMLDTVKPDLVSVGCQPACNAPAVIAALRRDVHVISDKPIANSREELDKLRSLAAAAPHLHLLSEFDMRARPTFTAAREAVRAGRIGEVALVQAQKSYRFGDSRPDYYKTREGYPGTIMFIGCHAIDAAYWITGLRFTSARALHGNIARRDYGRFEDHAAALFEFENGAACVVHADYLRPAAAPSHGDDRIRIAGSEGILEIREDRCELMTRDQPPHEICPTPRDSLHMAHEIIDTVLGNGSGALSTEDSLYIAEILLGAREAADTGRTVHFT